jgi:Mg/Co/Ni transporter MgtE
MIETRNMMNYQMWKECETLTDTVHLSWIIVINNGYNFNARILDSFDDILTKLLIIFTYEIPVFKSAKGNSSSG